MFSPTKKIFFYSLFVSAAIYNSLPAMELVKETAKSVTRHFLDKESLKIIGTGAATYVGFHALKNLALARVSKKFFGFDKDKSQFSIPLKDALEEIPMGLLLSIATAMLARSPLLNKPLTLSDLGKPIALSLTTLGITTFINGMWGYTTFNEEHFDERFSNVDFDNMSKKSKRKFYTVYSAYRRFYPTLSLVGNFFLTPCILLLRAKK